RRPRSLRGRPAREGAGQALRDAQGRARVVVGEAGRAGLVPRMIAWLIACLLAVLTGCESPASRAPAPPRPRPPPPPPRRNVVPGAAPLRSRAGIERRPRCRVP